MIDNDNLPAKPLAFLTDAWKDILTVVYWKEFGKLLLIWLSLFLAFSAVAAVVIGGLAIFHVSVF